MNFDEKVKCYWELTKAKESFVLNLQTVLEGISEQYPQFKSQIDGLFSDVVINEIFTKAVMPLYHKYYTEADIDNMIAFFKSETGQKLINNNAAMFKDSFVVMSDVIRELLKNQCIEDLLVE